MKFLGHKGIDGTGGFNDVEFYRIDRSSDGKKTIKQHAINQFFKPGGFIRLQVIVSAVEGEPVFTLFTEDKEFSTLEYGSNLYREVAKHILALRNSDDVYPIYITDIDLAPTLVSDSVQDVQTRNYLVYKKVIEDKLMQELK